MPDRLARPGVLDVLVDAAFIVSSDLRVIVANAAARSLLFEGDDPTGKELLTCVVPDDAPRLLDALDFARRGTRGYAGLHVRLQTAVGEPVHTELRVAALGQRLRSDTYLVTTPNTAPGRPGAAAPGGDFYALLARNAVETLGVDHVLIGRLEGSPASRVTTLANWSAGQPRDNLSYELEGTPCAETLRTGLSSYPSRVRELFPEHQLLHDLGAESYVGVSVLDGENLPQGLVALLGAGASRPAEFADQARLLAARVGAEMERERLAADSRQTEKRWLELIRGTPDGLFDITLGSGPVFLSRRCLELLGYSRACPARLDDAAPLAWVHPEDRGRLEAQIGRALQEGHHLQAAVRLRRRGGDHRWFYVHARLTRETTPGPVRALGFISETDLRLHGGVQDITLLRDLEATYLSARKMEAMALLAGGIAHDFANLVTGLDGFRDSVVLSLPEDHSCQADLAQMGDLLRSATGLSRQLLALARRQVLEPGVVSLNGLIAEMRPLLQRMVGDMVVIEVEPGGGLWPVGADHSQLEQVILNLALNARDAMPHGGRLTFRTRNAVFDSPLMVVSGERPAAPLVELEVRDTGVGMTPPTLARAFEPFFTTKPPGRATGLGLSTCLGVIQQLHGHLAVDSVPQQGTRFLIWLPPAGCSASPMG